MIEKKLNIIEIQNKQFELMLFIDDFCRKNNIKYFLIAGSCLGAIRHSGFIPWDDDIDIGLLRNDYEKLISTLKLDKSKYKLANYHNCREAYFPLTRIFFENTYVENEFAKGDLYHKMYMDIFPLDNVPDDDKQLERHINKIARFKTFLYYKTNRKRSNIFKILCANVIKVFLIPFSKQKIIKKIDKLMKKYNDTPTKRVCSIASQYNYKKVTMPKVYFQSQKEVKFNNSKFYVTIFADDYLKKMYGSDYMKVPDSSKQRKVPVVYEINKAINE